VVKYEIQKGRNKPVKFIGGLILGLLIVPFGAYLYFTGGAAPVATTDSDMPFENYFAHKALNARIAKDMPKNVPIQPTETNYVAGAELYKQHCGVCHGLPLSPKTAIATGMYPRPPQLFQGKGVTDDEPGETYWKIFNGIRLTGMPGFSKTLSETQMWQMALLLANADKLPPAAKAALVAPVGANAATTTVPLVSPIPPAPGFPSSAPAK
jgi:mono/diheme cytochrome c family protein